MTETIPEDHKQTYAHRRVALRRYADPEEVAHGTLNFCFAVGQFYDRGGASRGWWSDY